MKKNEELDKEKFNKSKVGSAIFLKATGLSLLFAGILLLITAFIIILIAFFKLNNFAKLTNTSIGELKNTFTTGWNMKITQSDDAKNILLLGTDSLESRPGSPALTDTIMLLSLNIKSGKVSTISLPRDLWSNDYATRINALYFYGQEKYPSEPERFTKEVVEGLTGVNIHHTIVLSIDSVAEIIEILGGIEVDVEQGFTDTEFPRPNVNVARISDPDKLYQTISFEKGVQKMNSEQALQFIRSRKSEDDQGNDLSRASRQQTIINSLILKLKNSKTLKNEKTLAKLYNYYRDNFSNQFSIEEGVVTLKEIFPIRDSITLNGNSISIYPEDRLGVITNPPTYQYSGEWVYTIRNRTDFKNEILTKLDLQK